MWTIQLSAPSTAPQPQGTDAIRRGVSSSACNVAQDVAKDLRHLWRWSPMERPMGGGPRRTKCVRYRRQPAPCPPLLQSSAWSTHCSVEPPGTVGVNLRDLHVRTRDGADIQPSINKVVVENQYIAAYHLPSGDWLEVRVQADTGDLVPPFVWSPDPKRDRPPALRREPPEPQQGGGGEKFGVPAQNIYQPTPGSTRAP